MTRAVYRESVFPADIGRVFALLKDLKTLQYIASPYAAFAPIDGSAELTWTPGQTVSFRFRLFRVIPFGTHTIHVIRFSPEDIYTNERGTFVPLWNHRIRLERLP